MSVAGSSCLTCFLARRERSVGCCGSSGCRIPERQCAAVGDDSFSCTAHSIAQERVSSLTEMPAAFPSRPVPAVSQQMRSAPPDPREKMFSLMLPRSSLLTSSSSLLLKLRFSQGGLGTGLLRVEGEVLRSSTSWSSEGRPWGACLGAERGGGGGAGVSHKLQNREGWGVSARRA